MLLIGLSPLMMANGPVDPRIALILGGVVLAGLVGFFWPHRGWFSRLQQTRHLRERMNAEDALKHIFKAEMDGRRPTLQSLAGALQVNLDRVADVVEDLRQHEFIELRQSDMRLTPEGRRYALNIIRAHRLWEQHLAQRTGVTELEWHSRAEHQEHFISPEQASALAAQLGHPRYDPHGDPIPTADGELVSPEALPVTALRPNQTARIVHIEDEPEAVYAQITAVGLCPGMVAQVLENSAQRVRLWVQGEDRVFAPVVAANISVVPVQPARAAGRAAEHVLSELAPGDTAKVLRLSPRCRGAERRRLMDLGILPGTPIAAELRSPGGNLTAYRVRDAMIALRQEQSDLIEIQSEKEFAA